uniref:Flap endonuclease 1 n=1 Tax=Trypanosoma congolense (strain IL3000) TaxID=1068625 RepID=F9WFI3_TRYCI|nr:unnamed protein product [Trypanosoma congolense IL3000]
MPTLNSLLRRADLPFVSCVISLLILSRLMPLQFTALLLGTMGVLGLSKLLYDRAPGAIKEKELKCYFGRRIAIDASMAVYQFVIAMKGFQEGQSVELTNDAGEVTSHLNGIFFRTLRMIDEGLRPIYVFDGKPPSLKNSELDSRRQRAEEAKHEYEKAKEEGDDEAMEKMSKRMVRVSREQMDEVKTLLQLMGIPVVQAPSEAEAQCAELVRKDKAWAVGTEDMDALAFGARVMLRHLTYGEAKKRPIAEYHLEDILELAGMTMEQFIDLCILLGCDYVPKIPGIGPHKAWEGIKKYGSMEAFLESLDGTKYVVPEGFNYVEARNFFLHPEVTPGEEIEIQFREPDEEGLVKFLVQEKLFNKDRVLKGIQRLRDALAKKTQGRLDQFFTITKVARPAAAELTAAAGSKRSRSAVSCLGCSNVKHLPVTRKRSKSNTRRSIDHVLYTNYPFTIFLFIYTYTYTYTYIYIYLKLAIDPCPLHSSIQPCFSDTGS